MFRRWRRQLRWLAGRGWSAEDFAERYAARGADAWGYRESDQHGRRAEWIFGALPQARFANALEVGCAQGFLSERLAARVDRLIACDISPDAVGQARRNCQALPQIEFCVADIRRGFPGDAFDLCLFSDVLYYLSARETDAVLAEAARKTSPGGFLLIANEWSGRARGLTPPTYSFARLDASALWERSRLLTTPLDETELSLAIYRRLPSSAPAPPAREQSAKRGRD
jgi:SAM-dependent methyltransferase